MFKKSPCFLKYCPAVTKFYRLTLTFVSVGPPMQPPPPYYAAETQGKDTFPPPPINCNQY